MAGEKLKRHKAPRFWRIGRKEFKFVVNPIPGPHPKDRSYPLSVLLRDVLGLVKNYREAKVAIKEGKVLIDGVVRREPRFPVGLFDLVEITPLSKLYRIVPSRKGLDVLEVGEEERGLKLCKITRKYMVRGGRLCYGLHDGRTVLDGFEAKVGDSLLIRVPSQEVLKVIRLEEGALALVIGGSRSGSLVRVERLKEGTYTSPRMAIVRVDDETAEVPAEMLFTVGKDKPVLRVVR